MAKLNYKVFGEGQAMIIIHGLFGSLDNWLGIAKFVATKGYQVYILDQRNHGKSPNLPEHDYEHMAADLKEFIEDHEIDKPILVGHSMGGKTVMEFSNVYPDSISKLVVVDIGPKYYTPHHHKILRGLNAVPIHSIKSRKEADQHLAEHINDVGIRQFLMKNVDRVDGESFQWKMNLKAIGDQIENIGQEIELVWPFELPTLFIAGGNSDYILPEDEENIRESYPNAKFVYIENAGHWVHAEQTETFINTLLNFTNA